MDNKVSIWKETALEPDLKIIDTHHHLWPGRVENVLDSKEYLAADLMKDFESGHNIVKSVFVECLAHYRQDGPEHLRSVGETEWIMEQEVKDGVMAGIVGFTDLRLGSKTEESLDEHIRVAGKRFKGVRHSVIWDPHPGVYRGFRNSPAHLLLDEDYLKGAGALAKRGLNLEVWAYFHQLEDLKVMAKRYPDLKIVICHLGGPSCMAYYADRREEVLAEWRKQIADLREFPNIYMKLGAVGLEFLCPAELQALPRTSEAICNYWKDEFLYCIDTFGPDRCMFESNYPPDSFLCDYVTLWNAYKRMTRAFSADEKHKLYYKTAETVYGF